MSLAAGTVVAFEQNYEDIVDDEEVVDDYRITNNKLYSFIEGTELSGNEDWSWCVKRCLRK